VIQVTNLLKKSFTLTIIRVRLDFLFIRTYPLHVFNLLGDRSN